VRPWGFRAVNLVLHAINAYQVSVIAELFHMEQPWAPGLLFAVGPFTVFSVSYISARSSILSTLFALTGVIAILSGFEFLALPCLFLSFYSKEDGAAFALLFAAVSYLEGGMWWFWAIPPLLLIMFRYERIKRMFTAHMTGAENMIKGGLPGSLPQPRHGLTHFVENLIRYPFWTIGFGQAPYHGSGIPTSSIFRTLLAFGILILMLLAAGIFPLHISMILLGPWLLYIAFTSSDILMEYRNYHSATGISLLLGLLPIDLIWVLAPLLATRTFILSYDVRNPIAFWDRCLKSGGGEKSRAWQEWASNQREGKRFPEARYGYGKALDLNPDLCPARQNLAWLNVQEGKDKEGLVEIRKAVKRTPDQAGAWLDLGLISEKNHRMVEAKDAYRTNTTLNPDSEEGWNRRGIVSFQQENYSEAIFCWSKVRDIKPKVGDYIWNLSWALKMDGDQKGSDELMKLLPPEIPMTQNMVQPAEAQWRLGV
jgi:tetratricopeptide (TPR) repeat protein